MKTLKTPCAKPWSHIVIILTILLTSSCTKFEDGRNFSLYSVKKRLCKSWSLNTNSSDPIYNYDVTNHNIGWCGNTNNLDYRLDKINIRFQDNGLFYFTVIIVFPWNVAIGNLNYPPVYCQTSGSGSWEFMDKKDKIRLTFNTWDKNGVSCNESFFTSNNYEEYQITRLTKNYIRLELMNDPNQTMLYSKNKR